MIARHDTHMDKTDLWSALAAPLPPGATSWRQDGRAIQRDGKWFARFVAYIDANTVRERLDGVVPGEWDLTLDLLPPVPGHDDDGLVCSFKARLQILGVIREDVGTGRDYKAAATDAFKRVAVRFGIAHELYAMEQNWVQVEGEGRFSKPLEDPQEAYDRRLARRAGAKTDATNDEGQAEPEAERQPAERAVTRSKRQAASTERAARVPRSAEPDMIPATVELSEELAAHAAANPLATGTTLLDAESARCPKCDGRMWDNRATKRNPKAPDFKCRDKPKVMGGPGCAGVIWPPRDGERRPSATPSASAPRGAAPASRGAAPTRPGAPPPVFDRPVSDDEVPEFEPDDDDLPF